MFLSLISVPWFPFSSISWLPKSMDEVWSAVSVAISGLAPLILFAAAPPWATSFTLLADALATQYIRTWTKAQ